MTQHEQDDRSAQVPQDVWDAAKAQAEKDILAAFGLPAGILTRHRDGGQERALADRDPNAPQFDPRADAQ
jgi:hypothetical protein